MDITIVQKPVAVSYTCCSCYWETSIPYDEFCNTHGSHPFDDWIGAKLTCPECGMVESVHNFEFE